MQQQYLSISRTFELMFYSFSTKTISRSEEEVRLKRQTTTSGDWLAEKTNKSTITTERRKIVIAIDAAQETQEHE